MEDMAERLKAKERELLDHVKKHNIRESNALPSVKGAQAEQAGAKSSGVLV